jgi:Zn-dependent protease
MMKSITLFRVFGLRIAARPDVGLWALGLWAVLSGVGMGLLYLPLLDALIGGLACAFLHYCGEFLHQMGHALAARRTGYPMTGLTFFFLLAVSRYPKDEPDLPGRTHITRALGGPSASLIVSLIAGGIAWAVASLGGLVWLVAMFWFLDNLLVFFLGAFLPLGFTDGSTILRYWGR